MTTKKPNIITEDDYTLVEKPDSLMYSVKIKKGKYTDVIVTYGEVRIKADPENDKADLHFKYQIVESPKKLNVQELERDVEFNNLLGDILTYILQTAFDTGNYKLGSKEKTNGIESTIDDSTETDQ